MSRLAGSAENAGERERAAQAAKTDSFIFEYCGRDRGDWVRFVGGSCCASGPGFGAGSRLGLFCHALWAWGWVRFVGGFGWAQAQFRVGSFCHALGVGWVRSVWDFGWARAGLRVGSFCSRAWGVGAFCRRFRLRLGAGLRVGLFCHALWAWGGFVLSRFWWPWGGFVLSAVPAATRGWASGGFVLSRALGVGWVRFVCDFGWARAGLRLGSFCHAFWPWGWVRFVGGFG